MPELERRIPQDLLEALNAHDLDGVVRLIASGYVGADVSRKRSCHGPEQVRSELSGWFQAFPDFHVSVRDVLVESPRVLAYWTMQGTHAGRFLHVPPTGRRITVDGFSLFDVAEAGLVRGLHLWDLAGMLRAMRLLPNLPAPSGRLGATTAPPAP